MKTEFNKNNVMLFARINPKCVDETNVNSFFKKDKAYCFFGILNKDKTAVRNILTGEILPYNSTEKIVDINGETFELVPYCNIKLQYIPRINLSICPGYRIYFSVHPSNDLAFISSSLIEPYRPVISFLKNDTTITTNHIKKVLNYFNNSIHKEYKLLIEDVELNLINIPGDDGRNA